MEVHPHWDTEPEQMGTKDKFWFRDPDDPLQCDWLFKFPTENTGQHWAEKIAYEIARKMRTWHRESSYHSIAWRGMRGLADRRHGVFLRDTSYIMATRFLPACTIPMIPSELSGRACIRFSASLKA